MDAGKYKTASAIWGGVAVFVLIFVWVYAWDYYVAPQAAVDKLAKECEFEANKSFALDIAKWTDQHHTDAFNPFRKQRDNVVATCVKKSGRWCSLDPAADWPCTRAWCFAPTDPLARWIYDLRYLDGAHLPCS